MTFERQRRWLLPTTIAALLTGCGLSLSSAQKEPNGGPSVADSGGGSPATGFDSGGWADGGDPGSSTTNEPDAFSPPTNGTADASVDGGTRSGERDAGTISEDATSPASSGSIQFHLLLGVSGSDTAGDTLTLTGDNYTDLIMSNFVAGVMYGHLITEYTPGMQFYDEYLYGSIFGQLLQENISTESYTSSSQLIDPTSDQQAVMGSGQGGPYQINNYAADMVYGSYAPKGYSLINYVALQQGIGYSFASAATQYEQATPPSFNNKYYGPMLTAYFHFNDYVALQEVGPLGGYTPGWEPAYDNALTTFKTLPNNFLEILLNTAYNQGYYGTLVSSYSTLGATATTATLATVDSYSAIWGIDDTYQQYPYQVRYYLDQLYDNPIPTTSVAATTVPQNHVIFGITELGDVFTNVFASLAVVDKTQTYRLITTAEASAAFGSALSTAGISATSSLDLSSATERPQIFSLLDSAIGDLETTLGVNFTARTTTAL